MAAKPLTNEAIALTEKKMDMTLDDIIKMSKKSTTEVKKQRTSNKSQKFYNNGAAQGKPLKLRQYMDSRSSIRQGALSKKRSNFQGNQFPLTTEIARKAAVATVRSRALNRNRAVNWNKPRVDTPMIQRKSAEGNFIGKQQVVGNGVAKQRPQTMDSLFANMKEQRMRRVLSQHNNVGRVGPPPQYQQQRRRRPPFGNFSN